MQFGTVLQKGLRGLVNEIDLYCTLACAIVLSILSIFNLVGQSTVLAAIPAVLALVCVVLLRNRSQGKHISSILRRISHDQSSIGHFFSEVDNMEEIRGLILQSKEVWMLGATLRIHIPALTDTLREATRNGLNVRLLLIEPQSAAMEMKAFEDGTMSGDQLSRGLEANLAHLTRPLPRDPAKSYSRSLK